MQSTNSRNTVANVVGAPVLQGLSERTIPADQWDERDACPICESGTLIDVGSVDAAKPGPRLAACEACAFVFLARRPELAWLEAYYSTDWDASGAPVAFRAHPEVREFCEPALAPGARVLDAGAGYGGALQPFADAGYDVQALEPSQHRAAFIRDELRLPSEVGELEQMRFEEPFDLVICRHVLEHLREPVVAVRALRAQLKANGHVYIAVPNLWFESAPQCLHYVPHHSLYTERALRRVLEAEGFEVVRSEADHELRILARRTEDARPPAAETDQTFLPSLEHWIAAGFESGAEQRLIAWWKRRDAVRSYQGYTVTWLPRRLGAGALVTARSRRDPTSNLAERLVRRVARGVPPRFASHVPVGRARLLPVNVSGTGLPVQVLYRAELPTVWLK
jgi:2-polyprenyl-3-methyl-5-hydroxy-6-metoxy-1,4-benzoquinol methylase